MGWGDALGGLVTAVVMVAGLGCDAPDAYDVEAAEGTDTSVDPDGEEPDAAPPLGAAPDASANYDCDFSEDFEGPMGAPWPEPWVSIGPVAKADLRNGWGRLRPETSEYGLARMVLPLDCQDFDAVVTVILTDKTSQAAAVYGRHNGGFLQKTAPRGRGYALTAENFRNPEGVSLWRELAGVEQPLSATAPLTIEPYLPHRIRMRVKQQTSEETLLQGKIWRLGDPEPTDWDVEILDSTNALRKRSGSIALDAYSSLNEGEQAYDIYFDDLLVQQAIDPPEKKALGW